MGWTSMRYTEVTHNQFENDNASKFIMNEFYNYGCAMAHLHKDKNQHELYMILKNSKGIPFICVCLIKIEKDEIYWKEMTEDCGLSYYNCPKEFFKFVSLCSGDYAKEWREKCLKTNTILNKIKL